MISRIIAVLLLFAPVPAMAGIFYTYAQWAALPADARAFYLAGNFDALITYAVNEGQARMGHHYSQCIEQSGMNSLQLAENILRFGSTRSALQTGDVTRAMGLYLVEVLRQTPSIETVTKRWRRGATVSFGVAMVR